MISCQINSSNEGKIREYQTYFGKDRVTVTGQDLEEPLADPLTIIQYKASQFENVVVDDVSLEVEGKDVGVNIRWLLKDLNSSNYLGRKCTFSCLVAIQRVFQVYVYKGSVSGTLIEPRGEGFGFGPFFLPDGASRTLGEDVNIQYNARYLAIQKLKANLPDSILPPLKEWKGQFQPH